MLIDAPRSVLLVIDMQDKVMPAISDHERLSADVVLLVRAAQRLGVPVAATEHCAKGLGHLVPAIRSLLPGDAIEAFRKDFPATRIIAISGGAPLVKTNYLDAAGLMGVDATLQKPFDVEELLRLLRTMQ